MHLLDIVIIVVYLAAMVTVGILSRGRQVDEADYFTGGFAGLRWLGVVIVGLSIGASFFSGISMLAYPSVAFSSGVAMALTLITLPLAGLVVLKVFLPRFFAAGVHEPYELIERKFDYPTRAVAAGMYVLLRVGWMGVLIYAPVMAIMAATGLSSSWLWPLVLAIGLSSTIYTTLGGIRGVLVTDAIQFLFMGVGIVGPIAYIMWFAPVDWSQATSFLAEKGHLQWFDFSFDVTKTFTFWSVMAGMFTANLAIYTADQMSLQRYLAAGDERSARSAFYLNIGGVVVVTALLIMLGLALSVWYGMVVDQIPPEKSDRVFPTFVAMYLPPGAPGLIFAAILAATMSSMTSGINSLAGCLTMDFVGRLRPNYSHADRLRFARWASLGIGLSATMVAGMVQHLGTIFDIAQAVIGVFLGPLLACMAISVSRLSVGPRGMIGGMLAGSAAGWCVAFSPASSLWVAPTAALVALAVATVSQGWPSLASVPETEEDPSFQRNQILEATTTEVS
ncbi:MAG: hypothetical protein WDZ51_00655 [Pirellulaceae bacterium]